MVEQCADLTNELHPVFGIPLLLTGCIGAAVADLGKGFVGAPVGIGSQAYSTLRGDKEPGAFPFHGNWCGPGIPPKGTNPPPVDELDRACQAHDKCYENEGYYSCRCDVQLIRDVRESNTMPKDIAQKAGLVAEYFQNSYCKGCKQVSSGLHVVYTCHKPQEFGCKMGPVSKELTYASCP